MRCNGANPVAVVDGLNLLGIRMIYRRLAALFRRYCDAHLVVTGQPTALLDEDGQTLGQVDRLCLRGRRLVVEGWGCCDQVVLSHAGQQHTRVPNLPRMDVTAAFPDLASQTPGYSMDLPTGEGPVSLILHRGADRLIYPLPMPARRTKALARARLIPAFLRDLALATPTILHWFATRDSNDRIRLKRHFRLATSAPSRAMQPLLFLADSLAYLPVHKQAAELARLHPASLAHRGITIVLPVYNALDLLPDVLDRVIRHTDLPWRLILIEDASTDRAVRPFLHSWKLAQDALQPDRITLIENTENQGFIRSVNRGLNLAIPHGNHVVLLNSDAFVPQDWATRLMRPFLAHDRVATVTPMSNDAEIFSVPHICQSGQLAPGVADAIDAVAAGIHPDAGLTDTPTGVGFCMAMSIDYLRRIPQLDVSFGRGYGEEVDWCQKARALGGRHLGLANLFVEHRGGTSFGSAEKQRLIARNNAVISRRYPGYDAEVQRFIADDPQIASRLALAIAWAAARASGSIPLYLAHDLGGGAEDYLTQRIARDLPDTALVLRVGTAHRWKLELHTGDGSTCGSTDDFALIKRLLAPIKRLHIVYSCGVGDPYPVQLPEKLLSLRRGPHDRIEVLVHDYLPISPSYTLLGKSGRYQGLPAPETTDAAHCSRRPDGTPVSLAGWQTEWQKLVAGADEVTVFSQSSARIFRAAYPGAHSKLKLTPHEMLTKLPRLAQSARPLQPVIGVLGNIGAHKGAAVLQSLSEDLDRTAAARLVVLGRVDPTYPLGASATVHGGYLRHQIPSLTARYGITDWLIPSIWPETFSYTTHEAIATGLPVWGFDLGAQSDAIRAASGGRVIAIPDGRPDLQAFLAALLHTQFNIESAAA